MVMSDGEMVHWDVDPAATVVFINHDSWKNPPDILVAEVATWSATKANLEVATATKLITLAGPMVSACEKHWRRNTTPSLEPSWELKVSHDNSHLSCTTAGMDT